MRLCLTEECRVQSLRKSVKAEEGQAAGYETGWERDGFSLWLRKRWLLCPTQEEQPKLPQGFLRTNPTPQVAQVGIAVMTLCSASSNIILLPVLYPIPPVPVPTQRKGCGSAPMWWEDNQKSPSTQVHPHRERLGTISAHPRCPAPSRVEKLWLETVSQETTAPAWVFKCFWWVTGDYCCLKCNSKEALLLSPVVLGLAVLVVPTEVEWGPETLTLSCFPRRGNTLWEASGRELQSIHWSNWPWE